MKTTLERYDRDRDARLFKEMCQLPPGVDADHLNFKVVLESLEHSQEPFFHSSHVEIRDYPRYSGLGQIYPPTPLKLHKTVSGMGIS